MGNSEKGLSIHTPPNANGAIDLARLGIKPLDIGLFVIGIMLNIYAYSSSKPIMLTLIFFVLGFSPLFLPKLGGYHERVMFCRVFAVNFIMAGVAAIYANYFNDTGQLYSDAGGFFKLASGHGNNLLLEELQRIHEGSFAIVIWRNVYNFFDAFGFPRERYVGILVNMFVVAFTGVITIKMARQVFGNDPYRFNLLTLMFSACGLFWLFAGIHMRDAFVLFTVSALSYSWIYFLVKPDLGFRLLLVILASLLATHYIGFLRGKFLFVPVAMSTAAVAALLLGRKTGARHIIAYGLLFIGLAVTTGLLMHFGEEIEADLYRGKISYLDHAMAQHAEESLGMAMIVNQPLPVRLVLGSLYLFVFPIPFWTGFQLKSAYHLFKSFNTLFFYLLIPLLILSLSILWKFKYYLKASIVFILFISIGFTLSTAGTSLETRHFGAFVPFFFILALLPDLRDVSARRHYMQLLTIFLIGVGGVHVAWSVLRFV